MRNSIAVAALSGLCLLQCNLLKKMKGGGEGSAAGEGTVTSSDDQPAAPSKPKGKAGAGCKFPDSGIEADFTLTKGCTVDVKSGVQVREGATLTIEPGATVRFNGDGYLWLEEGRIVAKGTAKEPITFTSTNKVPASGDFSGVHLNDKTMAGTVFEHVRFEYGGADKSGIHAALELHENKGRVSVTDCVFSHNETAVHVDGAKVGFAKFERNTITDSKQSIDTVADAVGSLGAGNKFGAPLHVRGYVRESATWPTFDQPVVVAENLEIGGEKGVATLTLAPKTVLKFNSGVYMAVGGGEGGSLVAKDVVFTSANPGPHAGDWIGLFIYEKASNVTIDGCKIEYAGAEQSGGQAAVTFYSTSVKQKPTVKIANTTFSSNNKAAIHSPDHECGDLAKAGNTSSGVPICDPQK